MKKIFLLLFLLIFMMSGTVFAEKQEWIDKEYDFKAIRTAVYKKDPETLINLVMSRVRGFFLFFKNLLKTIKYLARMSQTCRKYR